MAVVQFFINPIFSHIRPNLPLIDELVNRGTTILFYSLDPFKGMLQKHNVIYLKYLHYGGMFNWGQEKQCANFAERYEYLLQVYGRNFCSDFLELKEWVSSEIARVKPDIVIYDYFDAYWAKLAADEQFIPAVASICTFAVTSQLIDLAPEDCVKYVFRINDPMFQNSYDKSKILIRKLSNQIGRIFNCKPFPVLSYGNSNCLNLVHTSELIHPYRNAFDDTFFFCGYCAEPTEQEKEFDMDVLAERTIIYIAFGRTEVVRDLVAFYRMYIEAFLDSNYLVILSIGDYCDIDALAPIPDNFIIRNHVNQRKILKYADLFITHCGMNSVHEALYYGVPMCLLPWQGDQIAVAMQLSKLQTGIMLNPRHCSSQDLRKAADTVLSNPMYAANSKQCGDSLKMPDSMHNAADRIYKLIEADAE